MILKMKTVDDLPHRTIKLRISRKIVEIFIRGQKKHERFFLPEQRMMGYLTVFLPASMVSSRACNLVSTWASL